MIEQNTPSGWPQGGPLDCVVRLSVDQSMTVRVTYIKTPRCYPN